MSKTLKKNAETVSLDLGFSSLQEAIRVLLTKLSKREYTLRVEEVEEVTYLSKKSEQKFKKAVADIKAGKNIIEATDAEDFLRKLHA